MDISQKLTHSFRAAVSSSLGELFLYGLMACAVWLAFYVVFRSAMRHRRIASHDPTAAQMWREIKHSLRSIAIFGLTAAGIVYAALSGWTRLYIHSDYHGWPWFLASIATMIVVHDTYFYWTHRLMHHRRLFKFFHRTHHLSISPTPWAAYAFSPAEALVQAGIGPLIVFTIPSHPGAFAIFMIWQITFNVLGHCGYEVLPGWFLRSRAGCILNTVTHHAQHHERFRANFSLYFNVWDRLMGTNHVEYEERFAAVMAQSHVLAPRDALPVTVRAQQA
jgi:sterol desaturase/sphingolipid hydroxylase (fatty acid hydroxylase superfamily)